MGVRSLKDGYDFPSSSRQELYGDDQLVHVLWRGNMFLCAAACFRVSPTMTWSDFLDGVVDPWASSDPDYWPGSVTEWVVDGSQIDPRSDQTLRDVGVTHKSLIEFKATAR